MIWMANGKYRICLFVQNTPNRVTRKYFLILLIWEANRRTECWNSQEYHYVDSLFDTMNEFLRKVEMVRNETKQNRTNQIECYGIGLRGLFYTYLVLMLCHSICHCQFVKCFRIHIWNSRQAVWTSAFDRIAGSMNIVRFVFGIFVLYTLFILLYFYDSRVFYYKFHQAKGTDMTNDERHFFLMSAHIFMESSWIIEPYCNEK